MAAWNDPGELTRREKILGVDGEMKKLAHSDR